MEMPEGWKRWKNETNLLPDNMAVWVTKRDKDFTADLMAEMAEALETLESQMRDQGYHYGLQVLKKWREWRR